MSNNEPGRAKGLQELKDLRQPFGVAPLRIAAEPERALFVNAEPCSVIEKCLERFQILSPGFLDCRARCGNQLLEGTARLRQSFVGKKFFVKIKCLDFAGD